MQLLDQISFFYQLNCIKNFQAGGRMTAAYSAPLVTVSSAEDVTIKLKEFRQAETLVIFDFDWTLINENSDTWVLEKLGAAEVLKERSTIPWTLLMDMGLSLLHARGSTAADIEACLLCIPLEPAMARAVQMAASLPGCEVHVISDANSVYISTILEAHALAACVSSVHTNPAWYEPTGGPLRVRPFHAADGPPHGCATCTSSPNMCKGLILRELRAARCPPSGGRVVYLGDGGGDYCACLSLTAEDHVLARESFPLLQKILEQPTLVCATVDAWKSGEDVETKLSELLNISIRRPCTNDVNEPAEQGG
eukprot:jgi/Mesen1/691/ME000109S_10907